MSGDAPDDEERVWLVERDYDQKGLVRLVYATLDGARHLTRELSQQMLQRTTVTAARSVADDRLEPTPEVERERYAKEAERMAERHDPDDPV
ncbi:MAG: hypothetical protein V5A13_04820 [Haloarculaceae archaeon]